MTILTIQSDCATSRIVLYGETDEYFQGNYERLHNKISGNSLFRDGIKFYKRFWRELQRETKNDGITKKG